MSLLKTSLAIFIAGNLLEMGLRLGLRDTVRGLRNARFVALTLTLGFVLGPALAYGITVVLPLDPPHVHGLILLGMTPCAPFLPAILGSTAADVGYIAAFLLLTAVGTVVFMPLAVPLLADGLTVDSWMIAKPLLIVVLLPLIAGMLLLRSSATRAERLRPLVKAVIRVATVAVCALSAVVYGRDLVSLAGSTAMTSQLIFLSLLIALSGWLASGLAPERRIVLVAGLATRNVGAALAPLLSIGLVDQRAVAMVLLGFPLMVIAGILAAKCFGRPQVAARVTR